MADSKISALSAMTTPLSTDIIPIVDDPGGTPATQKITLANFLKVINDLTEDTNPDESADFIVTYDTSTSSVKKVKPTNLSTSASVKGRVEFLSATVPATLGAPVGTIAGASSPAESTFYFEFADAAIAYRDFTCRLINYNGGGLTLKFEVLRTSAAAASAYRFEAAIRRINTATEDITASHSYDYNGVTVTVPAGPPAAGIPMAGTITFTDGADMDSLANNEAFILRFRRDPTNGADNAGDTARVLASISMYET